MQYLVLFCHYSGERSEQLYKCSVQFTTPPSRRLSGQSPAPLTVFGEPLVSLAALQQAGRQPGQQLAEAVQLAGGGDGSFSRQLGLHLRDQLRQLPALLRHLNRTAPSDTGRHRQTQAGTVRHMPAPSDTGGHRQTQAGIVRHMPAPSDTCQHRQTQAGTVRHRQAPSDTGRHRETQDGTIRQDGTVRHMPAPSNTGGARLTQAGTIRHRTAPSDTGRHHRTQDGTVRHRQAP